MKSLKWTVIGLATFAVICMGYAAANAATPLDEQPKSAQCLYKAHLTGSIYYIKRSDPSMTAENVQITWGPDATDSEKRMVQAFIDEAFEFIKEVDSQTTPEMVRDVIMIQCMSEASI